MTITFETPLVAKVKPLAYTNKCNIVLIGGKAGVGKTTSARRILMKLEEERGLLFYLTAFAHPIKQIAEEHFGWDGKKDEKGRRLLQVLGADAGRAYDQDLWVKKLENRILEEVFYPYNFVIVDDWRYPNEAEYFKANPFYDVTTIRIIRKTSLDNELLASHESENSLLNYKSDFEVDNNETLEILENKLDSIVGYLNSKIIMY